MNKDINDDDQIILKINDDILHKDINGIINFLI